MEAIERNELISGAMVHSSMTKEPVVIVVANSRDHLIPLVCINGVPIPYGLFVVALAKEVHEYLNRDFNFGIWQPFLQDLWRDLLLPEGQFGSPAHAVRAVVEMIRDFRRSDDPNGLFREMVLRVEQDYAAALVEYGDDYVFANTMEGIHERNAQHDNRSAVLGSADAVANMRIAI